MTSYHRIDDIKKKFPEAFYSFYGNITETCKFFNVSRDMYYQWRKQDPEFAKLCDESIEIRLDKAEEVLNKMMFIDNVPSALFFFLKCKGRSRGYVEKTEIENTETVEVKLSDNDKDIIEQYMKLSEKPKGSKPTKKVKNASE